MKPISTEKATRLANNLKNYCEWNSPFSLIYCDAPAAILALVAERDALKAAYEKATKGPTSDKD